MQGHKQIAVTLEKPRKYFISSSQMMIFFSFSLVRHAKGMNVASGRIQFLGKLFDSYIHYAKEQRERPQANACNSSGETEELIKYFNLFTHPYK